MAGKRHTFSDIHCHRPYMGGFLATGLVNDPDFASNVTHAYLYNTPGLGGFLGPFINTVLGWIGFAEAYDQSKISNIEAATGISPISGLGFDAAPPIDIIIEDQMAPDISNPPGACDHSQQVLTDSIPFIPNWRPTWSRRSSTN